MEDISYTGFGDAGNGGCATDVKPISPDDTLKLSFTCANDFDSGLRSECEKERFPHGSLDCNILLATLICLALVIRAGISKEGDVCGVAYEWLPEQAAILQCLRVPLIGDCLMIIAGRWKIKSDSFAYYCH